MAEGPICHSSKRVLARSRPDVPGLWNTVTHADCMCNEYVAARNRVLGVVPNPTPRGMTFLRRSFKQLRRRLGHVEPLTDEEFLSCYSGKKRTRYENAIQSLIEHPLHDGDRWVSGFVKAEKFNPEAKENPDPRMIQSRNARYNVVVGKYLKAMEKRLYSLRSPKGTRLIAKGLSNVRRARLILKKWAGFTNPVVRMFDCSRWDKHLHEDILKEEHKTYQSMNSSAELAEKLSWQRNNKVRTSKGIVYKVRGKRMSGDMNTALGNCTDMVAMLGAAAEMANLTNWDATDDGDDCFVIVEQEDEWKLDLYPAIFLEFGQELKVDGRATDPSEIVFCQSRIVEGPRGPQMVRDWRKVLSQDCAGSHHWTDPNVARDMLTAVGTGNLAEAAGIPILQAYAIRVLEKSSGRMPKCAISEEEILQRYRREVKDWDGPIKPLDVTLDARISFWRSFGVCPETQRDIESRIQLWDPIVTEYDCIPPERNFEWRDNTPPDLIVTSI